MQAPGLKIVVFGTGGTIVLAVVGALLFGETSRLDAISARAAAIWATIPAAVVFLLPLLFTLAAWVLERLGLFQRVFGTLYKDLTDSQIRQGKHLSDIDKLRLTQMLECWKAPMPHLAYADGVLAFWGGKERWSVAGFDRCWKIALIYPLAVLLLVWAWSNNGQLGAATVIPPVSDAWRRWLSSLLLSAAAILIGRSLLLTNNPGKALRKWARYREKVLLKALVGQWLVAVVVAGVAAVVVSGAATVIVSGAVAVAVAVAASGAALFVVSTRTAFGFFAGAIAIPGAVGIATAVTVAVAVAVSGGVAVTVAFSGAIALTLVVSQLEDRLRRKFSAIWWPPVFAVVFVVARYIGLFAAIAALIPAIPTWGLALTNYALAAANTPFVILYMIGFLPLINAASDWVSLNATRAFLAQMQAGATRGLIGRLYVYDFVIALALSVLVYVAALGVIWMMQRFGWQVDVKSVLIELRDNPWSGQSTWLLTLAVTNFIPTLVHVALWMFGSVQSRDAETRAHIEQFLRDGGSSALRQIAPTIVSMLRIQPWLERAMVLSLTLALIPLFAICVPWAADWLLQRL